MLRERSAAVYFIMGAVAMLFLFNFGPLAQSCRGVGSSSSAQSQYAARVNGDLVRNSEFFARFEQQLAYWNQVAAKQGKQLDAAVIEQLGLREQVINSLVERELLAQQAQKLGIVIDDAVLAEQIRSVFGLKKMSYEQYEQLVRRYYAMNVDDFEKTVRHDLAAKTLMGMLADLTVVPESELKQEFIHLHNRVKLRLLRFDSSLRQVEKPTAAAIQTALDTQLDQLQVAYNRDLAAYRQPEQIKVHQIVQAAVPGLQESQEEATERVKEALAKALAKVHSEAEFIALQAQLNPNTASSQAQWIERGTMLSQLEPFIFSLDAQKVSPPFVVGATVRAMMVLEKKAEVEPAFNEVATKVAERYLQHQAQADATQRRAQQVLDKLRSHHDWEQVAAQLHKLEGEASMDVGWLSKSSTKLEPIGSIPKVLRHAMFEVHTSLPLLLPEVYVWQQHYVVVQILDREIPDLKQFPQDREELYQQALNVKRQQMLRDYLASLRNHARIDINPALLMPIHRGVPNAG